MIRVGAAAMYWLPLLALVWLTGCMATRYEAYNQGDEPVPLLERRVAYQVSSTFHRDPPDCALVLPLANAPSARHAEMIEHALSRHLSQRLPRVIGPMERAARARRLAVDLETPDDRRVFARAADCPALVEAALFEVRDDYVVVWAHRSLGLEVVMTRADDQILLWRARHRALRSDGGLPLSPISAAVSGVEAARFRVDGDMTASMADDVVRRIIASLPDVRYTDGAVNNGAGL